MVPRYYVAVVGANVVRVPLLTLLAEVFPLNVIAAPVPVVLNHIPSTGSVNAAAVSDHPMTEIWVLRTPTGWNTTSKVSPPPIN